ncbi:MAG: NAD-dependent DNA ligase LigA [Defluviitaleaceae bacterium]|nr:NAD-dependent DNA ligase LigA [Defluviitaleaceae bacterium]
MERMTELVNILNEAASAYENDREIMSDFEYDRLYDELLLLEANSGVVLENSPTQKVGYEVASSLEKVRHHTPLLSLDKTKEIGKLESFLADHEGVLSWKLDGLTIVLKYSNGLLSQALTRGNGEVGEDVTHNAKFFRNIPKGITFKGDLWVRGEAVISFTEFERINEGMEGEKYKNPRNLCAGTIRQLNSRIAASRKVDYFAFAVLEHSEYKSQTKERALVFLADQGFALAEYKMVNTENVADAVEGFKQTVDKMDYATDGLVLTYDDVEYSASLGATSKFPRDSLAFKWADELATTRLIGIEWNTSRTGLINPIALFEPVDIEGSTVARASLHNVSIAEGLELGVGDEISVYKANMIIPQIDENFTRSGFVGHPDTCPVCDHSTILRDEKGVKTLHCDNAHCRARVARTIVHYVGRDGANIEGLSEKTIEKFIDLGYISNFSHIYKLGEYAEQIKGMEGFGERSYAKLTDAIEKSKTLDLANFIYALGIDNIGLSGAKSLCRHFGYDFDAIRLAEPDDFSAIDGFGDIMAQSIYSYFRNPQNNENVDAALSHLNIKRPETVAPVESSLIAGKTFVITGDLKHFDNRKALTEYIEELGGKVAGSVSKKTNYLINNDTASASSKNKKAQELGVTIIDEQGFLGLVDNNH